MACSVWQLRPHIEIVTRSAIVLVHISVLVWAACAVKVRLLAAAAYCRAYSCGCRTTLLLSGSYATTALCVSPESPLWGHEQPSFPISRCIERLSTQPPGDGVAWMNRELTIELISRSGAGDRVRIGLGKRTC